MDDNKKSTLLLQYGAILGFISMSLGALIWFGIDAIFIIRQLISMPLSISFDKGAFYMLGIGIGLGALVIYMILEVWKKKPPSDRLTRRIVKTALFGVAIMFLLPQVAHYSIAHYLEKRGYEICHKVSYQWLHYQNIVFTNDQKTCSEVANKKK